MQNLHVSPIVLILLLMSLTHPISSAAQSPDSLDAAWQAVAAHFHQQVQEEGIVGASMWLVRDGEVLKKEFEGYANLARGQRVNEQTIYHWASITKTVTGIAVMQLRDQERLALDDAVVDYLPSLRKVHNPYGAMDAITIRHLMSHSAGFRSPTWPWGGDESWHPHEPTEWEQLVAMMPYTEIHFAPGTRYKYSNPGIIFLGRIIEQLTGDDYETYVEKNIFSPLGMHRSYFDATPEHLLKHRSNNYTVREGKPVPNGRDFDTGITVSNGGLNAPIPDMVSYLSFLMDACEDEACRQVLERESLQEMWEPQVPLEADVPPDSARLARPWQLAMGLTFFSFEQGDVMIVGHTGSQKSFRSFFYLEPATGTAAIASFNTVGDPKPDTVALMAQLQQRLFQDIFPLFR